MKPNKLKIHTTGVSTLKKNNNNENSIKKTQFFINMNIEKRSEKY